MDRMFNKEHFNEFLGWSDKETILIILDEFLKVYNDRLTELADYVAHNDFPNIKFHAHSLKNLVMYYSPYLSNKAELLSEKGKKGDPEGMTELMEELIPSTEVLAEEIRQLIIELKAE